MTEHRCQRPVGYGLTSNMAPAQGLMGRVTSAEIYVLDDAITIVTADTNLGNILETWGIPFREVNAFSLHNQ